MATSGEPTGPPPLEERTVRLAPLLKILECPVCLDLVKSPPVSCERGHLLCPGCSRRLLQCPCCEAGFSPGHPVVVKNLLEALPRKCHFSDEGCPEVLEPGAPHEKFCQHRPMFPGVPGMAAVRVCDAEAYFKELSLQSVVEGRHEHAVLTDVAGCVSIGCLPHLFKYAIVPISVFDHFFWLVFRLKTQHVAVVFHAFFVGEPQHDAFVRVTLKNDELKHEFTLKADLGGELGPVLTTHDLDESMKAESLAVLKRDFFCDLLSRGVFEFDYELFLKPKEK